MTLFLLIAFTLGALVGGLIVLIKVRQDLKAIQQIRRIKSFNDQNQAKETIINGHLQYRK